MALGSQHKQSLQNYYTSTTLGRPSENWKEIVFDKFNFSGEVSKYNAITSNLGDSGLGVVNTEITTNYINKSRPNVSFQSW